MCHVLQETASRAARSTGLAFRMDCAILPTKTSTAATLARTRRGKLADVQISAPRRPRTATVSYHNETSEHRAATDLQLA